MQVKKLLKRNTVCIDDRARVVVKAVKTPFKSLTQAWCAHEAGCLQALAELGFANAPRLISSTLDSFTMEQIEGPSLTSANIDEDIFLRLMDVIDQLHGLGFAHGNLRPNNILLRGGTEPFLIDFETCCRRPNLFFLPTRLGDHVRLYLIWQSRVPQSEPETGEGQVSRLPAAHHVGDRAAQPVQRRRGGGQEKAEEVAPVCCRATRR